MRPQCLLLGLALVLLCGCMGWAAGDTTRNKRSADKSTADTLDRLLDFIQSKKAVEGKHAEVTGDEEEVTRNWAGGEEEEELIGAEGDQKSTSSHVKDEYVHKPAGDRQLGDDGDEKNEVARAVAKRIACENKQMSLACPRGRVLRILYANYGRTNRGPCPHRSIRTTNCVSKTSRNKMKQLCDGKTHCRVTASNKVFGDTCVGTYKYLAVGYICVRVPRKVSCEHRTMALYCRRGLILNILSATYGRSDRTTCRHSSMGSTQCAAASSLSTVRQQCQNKRYCRVTASNRVFGDPCRGTFKYLTVTYNCVAATSRVACEGHSMQLSCPSKRLLYIRSANYGRTDRQTCPSKHIRTTKCSAASSLTTARQRCQDKSRCVIVAANSVFGDPCVGTYKYLRVSYQCNVVRRMTTCEHRKMQLNCGRGKVHIVSANYGRSDRTTCPSRSIKTTSCAAATSLAKVRAQCEGQSNCVVTASNSVFGDPCVGTYKYLTITYMCIA